MTLAVRAAGLALIGVAATGSLAQGPPVPEDPDAEEVAAALAEAGQAESRVRLARLGATASPVGTAGLGIRADAEPHRRPRREARAWWRTPAWSAAVRAVTGPGGPERPHGWLAHERRTWSVLAGRWTWAGGHGLVAGGAGRRPGLTADAGLGPRRPGPRPTGQREGRGIHDGAALAVRRGGWRLAAAASAEPSGRLGVLGLGRADGRSGLLCVVPAAGPAVAGITAGSESGPWSWSLEAARPLARRGVLSWALHGGWGRRGRTRVEGLALQVPGTPSSPLAGPSTLVGSRGGWGWAVRASRRLRGGPRLALLVASSRRETAAGPEARRLGEVIVEGSGAGGAWEAAWRRQEVQRPSWSPETPWEPPSVAFGPDRTSWTLRWRTRRGRDSWLLDARSLRIRGAATEGRRTLVAVARTWGGARGAHARAGLAQAWGERVDLVTVVVPLPGRGVVRHWGRWQAEAWLGAGWRGGGVHGALALHRRLAADGAEAWELRAEATARW